MGSKQLGFREHELNTVKKRTKREKFLALMEANGARAGANQSD